MAGITIERKALQETLSLLGRIVPRRTSIPILSHVRINVNGETSLSATDMEMSAEFRFPGSPDSGKVTLGLPLAQLAAHVRTSKAPAVTFSPEGEFKARVNGAAVVQGADPADFPTAQKPEGDVVAELDCAELARAIEAVEWAVSREVTRYTLTGILLEAKGKTIHCVTSDGKRLAAYEVPNQTEGGQIRLVIPEKSAEVLQAICRKRPGTVKVQAPGTKDEDPTCAFFVGDDWTFRTRLIEGNFPDWEAVMPYGFDEKGGAPSWTLPRTALKEALETVLPCAPEKDGCAVKATFLRGTLKLFTRTADVGEAAAEVLGITGQEELVIGLSAPYVLDYLKSLPKGTEEVRFTAKDKASCTLWTAEGGAKYALMPYNVGNL
jgi:DNA polymerase-3 subunit beta